MSENTKTLLLVLGMHRSGTSMCTGITHGLGIDIAKNATNYAGEDNRNGYFEDLDLARQQDNFLKLLNSHWADTSDISPVLFSQHKTAITSDIESYLFREFENTDTLAIKDPRVCRLLPLWLSAATNLDIQVKAIILYRHPSEVSQSLNRRDGMPSLQSELLWLSHYIAATKNTEHIDSCTLFFDEISNQQDSVSDALDKLGITVNSSKRIGNTVDQSLINHIVSDDNSNTSLMNDLKENRSSTFEQNKILTSWYDRLSKNVSIEDYNKLVNYMYTTLNDSADNLRKLRNYEWIISQNTQQNKNNPSYIARLTKRTALLLEKFK
jgi:hypothetical protein